MKYHVSSSIIIRPKDNKIFIAKRSYRKKLSPGMWEMVGGKSENGESPVKTIRREIKEELGVKIRAIKEFKDYDYKNRNYKVFIIKLSGKPKPNTRDFSDWGWFSEKEIKKLKFALNCKKRLKDYFKMIGGLKG